MVISAKLTKNADIPPPLSHNFVLFYIISVLRCLSLIVKYLDSLETFAWALVNIDFFVTLQCEISVKCNAMNINILPPPIQDNLCENGANALAENGACATLEKAPETICGNKGKGSSTRIAHIDIIRGVTMLLVVLGHVCLMYPNKYITDFCNVLRFMRMPMFFFISGFLVYSDNFDKEMLIKRCSNRLCSQLFPTIIIGGIYYFSFFAPPWYDDCCFDLKATMLDWTKRGYWFSFVLVEMFFIAAPLLFYFTKFKLPAKWRMMNLFAFFVCCESMEYFLNHLENGKILIIMDLLSAHFVVKYLIYFILGCIAKMYINYFHMVCRRHNFGIFAMICYTVIALTATIYSEALSKFQFAIVSIACGVVGIISMMYLFYWLSQVRNRLVKRLLSYLSIVGTSTLPIYLFHYFCLSTVHKFGENVIANKVVGTALEVPFVIVFAVFVVIICILIVNIMKKLGIYSFIFPSSKKISQRLSGMAFLS